MIGTSLLSVNFRPSNMVSAILLATQLESCREGHCLGQRKMQSDIVDTEVREQGARVLCVGELRETVRRHETRNLTAVVVSL